MLRRALTVCGSVVVVIVVLFAASIGAERYPQGSPTPSSPLDLVPVSVHAVDEAGRPVTDLKQSDFTVTENGSVQQIRYFSVENLAAGTAPADGHPPVRTRVELSPQDHRVFVIVLGRGRLEDASGTITSLAAFVRGLLPQDRVALFAHNRALTFTTDHEKVAQALERCRKSHADVDLEVDSQLGPVGMGALYGTKAVGKKMQAKIDAMVAGPGIAAPERATGDTIDLNKFGTLSLDDFMFSNAHSLTDQGNLRTLMEYLRRLDGEKDVLFVTENGVDKSATVPSAEVDRYLAQAAADGFVALHVLQAGGIDQVAARGDNSRDSMNAVQTQALAFKSLRNIAELSGGTSAIMESRGSALVRLDEMTRNSYLIGYQPLNSSWDGAYRTIAVKVNRPGLTLFYRRGYYRILNAGSYDRRGEMTTDRLTAAGSFRREVDDIKIKAKATQGAGGNELIVEGRLDVSKLALAVVDGKHAGELDIAVFCIDSSGWSVGTHTSKLPILLTEEDLARYRKDGLPYSVHFPLFRGTNRVRFVVYDYRSDLVGRADTKIF